MVWVLTRVPPGKITNFSFGLIKLWASMAFLNICRFVATSSLISLTAVKTSDGLVPALRDIQCGHTQVVDVGDTFDIVHFAF
jgi:hypothetical protein